MTRRPVPSATKARTSPQGKRQGSVKRREKAIRKRLEIARDHVIWASGIVTCCAYAASAGLFPEPARDDIGYALDGAHALIERAGGALMDVLDDELDDDGDEHESEKG